MIALIAKLNVAARKEAEFEKVLFELAEQVRANEHANDLFTLVKDDDGYAVFELYDDDAALQTHMQSQHFRDAGAKFAGLMAGPPTMTRYEVVGQRKVKKRLIVSTVLVKQIRKLVGHRAA